MPSLGLGGRLALVKEPRLNARCDLAWGGDGLALRIKVGKEFWRDCLGCQTGARYVPGTCQARAVREPRLNAHCDLAWGTEGFALRIKVGEEF